MKKVVFFQLNANSYGGVWQVNKMIGEKLVDLGYDVEILSLREHKIDGEVEHDERLKLLTINKDRPWGKRFSYMEILNDLKRFKLWSAIKKFNVRMGHNLSILKDKKKIKKHLASFNPDYIITSHYQLIGMIPKKYYKILVHEQHSSLIDALGHRACTKTFYKYNGKIRYLWLTKKTMENALGSGITNGYYIYNPVRFISEKSADVINNKKLVTIARLSEQKRLDLMISIVKEVFSLKKYKDWVLEIYGSGEEEEKLRELIKDTKQIKLMGVTNDPKEVLMTSSINLNTSSMEGFAMSILEAQECGVPTVSFDFGESVKEEIINNKTGIIADNRNEFVEELIDLMDNSDKLRILSSNCKKFSEDFHINKIIKEWEKLFKQIDGGMNG